MTALAFVGAGSMGRPMIDRLLVRGFEVRVYARRAEARAELATAGAVVAESVAEAVRGVDLCVLCLFSADQVADVALGDHGVIANLPAGAIVVVHTTVEPATLHRLSEAAAARNVSIVDAPVSGTADSIRQGKLTVLFGGERAAVDRCEQVVGSYAEAMIRVGDVGMATKVKLVNNLVFAAHVQVAESAWRLGERLGIDGSDLVAALAACSGDSYVFAKLRELGIDALGNSVRYLRKDVAAVDQAARDSHVDLGPLREVVEAGPLQLTET